MVDRETLKLHPTLLVKPGTVSRADIRRAEKLGGICIVECNEPEAARFVEPPTLLSTDALANAALRLVRYVLAKEPGTRFDRDNIAKTYVEMLLKGSEPSTAPAVQPAQSVKR